MRRRVTIAAGVVAVVALVAIGIVTRRDSTHVVAGPAPTTTATPTVPATGSTTSSTPSTASSGSTSGATSTTTGSTATTTMNPTPVGPAVAIRRGNPDRRAVALTFDAGSDLGYANQILDFLATQGVKATFGMAGQFADAHPAVVQRMVREGHQLLNHSYDHPSFTGRSTGAAPLSRTDRLDQLARAEAAIRAASGASSIPWFRPPYGDEDASVRADVALAGYGFEVLWTVDSLGWKGARTVCSRTALSRHRGERSHLPHACGKRIDRLERPSRDRRRPARRGLQLRHRCGRPVTRHRTLEV
jgi:peptidoglycan/xylan/chitin deacetylase (PgdA/CDA1 family)